MEIIVAIFGVIAVYIFAGIFIWKTNSIILDNKQSNEIDNKKVILGLSLHYEDDMKILDAIIDDEFTQYQIMNLAHQNNLYINPEMQEKIIVDILGNVIKRLSDNFRVRLSLYYNDEYIDDIIFNKIKLVVINYTIEVNGNYKK